MQELENALVEIENLKHTLATMQDAYSQDMEEGLAEAYQLIQEERAKYESTIEALTVKLETVEADLYAEYEVMLKDQKNFMIAKVDKYLKQELGKMLNYFPEHADKINEWKNAHPAAVVVEQAINQVEVE